MALQDLSEDIIEPRCGVVQKLTEPCGAVGLDVFVGVFCAFHAEHAGFDPCGFQNRKGFLCGALSRLVRVVGYDHMVGIVAEQARVLGRDGGPQCCDRLREAGGVHGDDVHVALAQHQTFFGMVLGVVERVQNTALMKGWRIR